MNMNSGNMGASKSRFSECGEGTVRSIQDQQKLPAHAVPPTSPFNKTQPLKKPQVIPRSFIDIEFPPCDESINKKARQTMLSHLSLNADTTMTGFDRIVQWRRPIEYMNNRRVTDDEDEDEKVLPRVFPATS